MAKTAAGESSACAAMRRSFGIAAVCRAVCLALLLKLGGFFGNGAAFAAPEIFKTLKARVESSGGQIVTDYSARKDFLNHQLFNGLNRTEVKLAAAVVPNLREFLANPLPGETDGAHPLLLWKNGKYANVPTADVSEKWHLVVMGETLIQVNEALQAIENNQLMDPQVSKLPRCALVLVNDDDGNDGNLQSELKLPGAKSRAEAIYLRRRNGGRSVSSSESERLMELRRSWVELALPPETFQGQLK